MEKGMPLRDPSTYGFNGFVEDSVKNAHDKANLTAPQPDEFPSHNLSKEFFEHMDNEIDY